MRSRLLFFRASSRMRDYRRHLRTRRAYCLLAFITYTNGLLYALMMASTSWVLNLLFSISSILIGVSITGLYLNRPLLMLPDIIYKAILAGIALFYAIQEADAGKQGSLIKLLLASIGFAVQLYENNFLFRALALAVEDDYIPPPTYDLFTISNPNRGISSRKREPNGSNRRSTSSATNSNPSNNPNRSDTPPPTYDVAISRIPTSFVSKADVPSCSHQYF